MSVVMSSLRLLLLLLLPAVKFDSNDCSLLSEGSKSFIEEEEESPGGGGGALLCWCGLAVFFTWPTAFPSGAEVAAPSPGEMILTVSVSFSATDDGFLLLVDGGCLPVSLVEDEPALPLSAAFRCRGGLIGGPGAEGADGNFRRVGFTNFWAVGG